MPTAPRHRSLSIGLAIAAHLAAFVTLCLVGAADANAGAKVYMMRGLADVSTGLDALAVKMKRVKIGATVDSYTAESDVAARALRDYKASGGPIVLIGHSLGADAAIGVAETLRRAGVPVALMVTFSPAHSADVPANVARVVSYYQSNSVLWNSTYKGAPGFRGSLRQVDLAKEDAIDHFNIEKVERFHTATIAAVQSLSISAPVMPAEINARHTEAK